ncbi:hypothetical protein H696_02765 [Fonticula alba]|uniref:Mitochondrial potassium channel ATP-binding subunit n=1 Tax=Fonticula alba TaxID=691883 RepID=A0A058ZA61_FONAL|nr:hypothetical protein H696_02765 [Fonticula alba]KCV70422.1 hypothetical protein H696_02765 [Fonticula alba]|eukprot:XP_009494938.1 hypothetical protein H696_02765 [Fonticula alba]
MLRRAFTRLRTVPSPSGNPARLSSLRSQVGPGAPLRAPNRQAVSFGGRPTPIPPSTPPPPRVVYLRGVSPLRSWAFTGAAFTIGALMTTAFTNRYLEDASIFAETPDGSLVPVEVSVRSIFQTAWNAILEDVEDDDGDDGEWYASSSDDADGGDDPGGNADGIAPAEADNAVAQGVEAGDAGETPPDDKAAGAPTAAPDSDADGAASDSGQAAVPEMVPPKSAAEEDPTSDSASGQPADPAADLASPAPALAKTTAPPTTGQTLAEICSLLWLDKWWFLFAVSTAVASAAATVLLPAASGQLLNILRSLADSAGRRAELDGSAGSLADQSALEKIQHLLSNAFSYPELNAAAARFLGLVSLQASLSFCYGYAVSIVGENLSERLRKRLFDNLLHRPIAFHDGNLTSDLVASLTGDIQEFKSSVKSILANGVRLTAQTVGGLSTLVLLSPSLTSVLLALLPAVFAIGASYGRTLRRKSRLARQGDAAAAARASEVLAAIRTVRAFNGEDLELACFAQAVARSTDAHRDLGFHMASFGALTSLAFNAMYLGVLFIGGGLVIDSAGAAAKAAATTAAMATEAGPSAAGRLGALFQGVFSSGALVSFLMTTQSVQANLAGLIKLFAEVNQALGAGARVLALCRDPAFGGEASGPAAGGPVLARADLAGADILFRGVDFAYPSRPDAPVLVGLDLRLPAGKVTAVCGASGSGKSTLAALLERFYEPTAGEILLVRSDGRAGEIPLTAVPAAEWRQHIGYISQDPVLFGSRTLGENIAYSKATRAASEAVAQAGPQGDVTERAVSGAAVRAADAALADASAGQDYDVMSASLAANAAGFVVHLPEGYATGVGERGGLLSGGQRQRVAIARAIVPAPQVLVLDEATSALDPESEAAVQLALESLMAGGGGGANGSAAPTTLVIAHRLSTIRNADQICVMSPDARRVVEQGTHEELIAQRGIYYEMTRRAGLMNSDNFEEVADQMRSAERAATVADIAARNGC